MRNRELCFHLANWFEKQGVFELNWFEREELKILLNSEYVKPPFDWSKVPIDAPILVSRDGERWYKRHFAKFEKGMVYAWLDGATSWTTKDPISTTWKYAKLQAGKRKELNNE